MKIRCFISGCLFACASVYNQAQVNPGVVHMGPVYVGTFKAVEVEVQLTYAVTLGKISVFTGGLPNKDFRATGKGTCQPGAIFAANSTCTIEVEFIPKAVGERFGSYAIESATHYAVTSGYLQGTAIAPYATFVPALASAPFTPDGSVPYISSIAIDDAGGMYIAAPATQPSPGFVLDGFVYPVAGSIGGNGGEIVDPYGVAVDSGANVYVFQDEGVNLKYSLQADGTYSPNYLPLSTFSQAIDGSGNFYSPCNAQICKEELQADGSYLENELNIPLTAPAAVAVDGSTNLYVIDNSPVPVVYRESNSWGTYTRSKIGSGWVNPTAINVDGVGNVYVTDSGNVFKATLQANGSYKVAPIFENSTAYGVQTVSPKGDVYATVFGLPGEFGPGYGVVELDSSKPGTLAFESTSMGSASGPQSIVVTNSGNAPLHFSGISFPADFYESYSGKGECKSSTVLAQGASCTITIAFSPLTAMSSSSADLSETVTLTTNTLNSPATPHTIQVFGTAVNPNFRRARR